MRTSAAVIATGIAWAAVAAAPAPAVAASPYCSPTGDLCHQAVNRGGVVRIMFDTLAFRGRVRVCVTDPSGDRACNRFRLRSRNGGFGFTVRWSRHFPNGGRGRYRVRFYRGGAQLGPADTFRR